MVSDAKVAPVRARAPLAASVWHPWYVHWPFITGPVEVPIAELEVEVVVVPPTAVEVLTVEPGGTTTIVTAMHGFVGSKAKREKLVSDAEFWFERSPVQLTYRDYLGANIETHNPCCRRQFARKCVHQRALFPKLQTPTESGPCLCLDRSRRLAGR
jgi:hypothetical protein